MVTTFMRPLTRLALRGIEMSSGDKGTKRTLMRDCPWLENMERPVARVDGVILVSLSKKADSRPGAIRYLESLRRGGKRIFLFGASHAKFYPGTPNAFMIRFARL